ncbi:LacI family DNA-binding transcriptional regulator [Sphingobium sp. H33]|uniref:LacI family DNA-binding transcriptional regulator n=2 Tax=Sphingobium nicotianae TaxID=2782607 RepID=A0A9X1DDC5_9SPHN|nr:LacI family DNA-binding transcriptional regulator [Sphingobium nicotianae]
MHEVAELAGVSRMTVSRALNHPEKVKEKVRQRVFDAVSQLGYVHNHLARSLSSSKSNVIGLVLPSLENSIFSATVKAISDVLRPAGFQLMLAESSDDPKDEEIVISNFLAQRVAGLVLHSTRHSPAAIRMLRGANVPVVENGDMPVDPIDMVVSYSNRAAAKAMTLHLARMGYSKIGFASLANPRATERQLGYLDALAEAGLAPDPRRIVNVSRGFGGGAEAIAHIEHVAPDTDALFCAGDVLAVGALLECNRRGWAVPGRLAIASFDDLDLLRHVNPAITALRLPRAEIGRRSAEMLLARIFEREIPVQSVDLGFEIVQRASS